MKKFKMFLSLTSEENWINSIQESGYRLTKINAFLHCYTFKALTDDQFNPYVRLDFREKGMSKEKYAEYKTLFSDSGWQLLKECRSGGTQYFQQKSPEVSREIFSDTDSRVGLRKRYIRFSYMYGVLFLLYSMLMFKNSAGINLLNFRSWYFTPGIWQMSGIQFWRAFIFESPIVIFRILPPFVLIFFGFYYLLRALVNEKPSGSSSRV